MFVIFLMSDPRRGEIHLESSTNKEPRVLRGNKGHVLPHLGVMEGFKRSEGREELSTQR